MNLALDYGADAVYLGPPLYSLRARENDFQPEALADAIQNVHQRGKKVYMTLNIFARNRKVNPFSKDILSYAAMKPDAFIMSDPGFISIARELAPEIPIHLSVQANCMNWQAVRFWKKSLGVERIILSRELSLNEIKEIKDRVPEVELEAFVHGSICIAYSGRCLLSSYFDRRDANQGVCDNSCREKYRVFEGEYYIEDPQSNPGKFFPVEEDEQGTYILNAKDLCMIEHLKEMADAGVCSFKVEGRTKSEFYAAMIARAYRGALDDLANGKPFDPRWRQQLSSLTSRGYHTAFMFEDPSSHGQNYQSSTQAGEGVRFLGLCLEDGHGRIKTRIKNRIQKLQKVTVISPSGPEYTVKVQKILSLDGVEKNEVHSGAGDFVLLIEGAEQVPKNSLLVSTYE